MAKAPSTKNIEKALGIADDVSKLNNITSDEEKKKQFAERQEKLKVIQEQFKKKRTSYEDDKDFVKDMYKELVETGMMAARIMQEEAGMTGDYKNVEALAAVANAVKSALDGLKSVEIDEEKLRIERDKVDIKRTAAANIASKPSILGSPTVNNTTVYVGSTGDLIRALKQADKDENKTIDAAAEIVKTQSEKDYVKDE